MEVKHYGIVTAKIDDQRQRVELSFSPRGKQPLDAKHPQRCLSWAITALKEYTDRGYYLVSPGMVKSG